MLYRNLSKQFAKAVTSSEMSRAPVLENMLVGTYQDPALFVARTMFRTLASEQQTGTYHTIRRADTVQNKSTARSPGVESQAGSYEVSPTTYMTSPRSYKEIVPEELAINFADAGLVGIENVAQVLRIGSEIEFASKFWKIGVWNRDVSGAGTAGANAVVYWSNPAATPAVDIKKERKLIGLKTAGKEANTLVLGSDVEDFLLEHPTLLSRLNGGQTPVGPAIVNMEYLAQIFGVDKVVTSKASYNSAPTDATVEMKYCLAPKSAWLGYVDPSPAASKLKVTAGFRFTWAGLAGNDEGARSWDYWDQKTRATHIEGQIDESYNICDATCGVFFDNVVQ